MKGRVVVWDGSIDMMIGLDVIDRCVLFSLLCFYEPLFLCRWSNRSKATVDEDTRRQYCC